MQLNQESIRSNEQECDLDSIRMWSNVCTNYFVKTRSQNIPLSRTMKFLLKRQNNLQNRLVIKILSTRVDILLNDLNKNVT